MSFTPRQYHRLKHPSTETPGASAQWPSEALGAWVEWLRTRKWDYWLTATFARPVNEAAAQSAALEWLRAVGAGTQHSAGLYAAWAVERGSHLARTHVHCVLGGVGAVPAHRTVIREAWRYGLMDLARYDPRRDVAHSPHGACAYLCKHPADVQLFGRLKKYRPRRRD